MRQHWVEGDFEVCVCEANGFLETAEWCVKDLIGMPERMKYPFVVNISFACELFLKVIMIHESGTSSFCKGHDLKELYYALSPMTQEIIREEYENKGIISLRGSSIDVFLDACRNDFENWRYAFEKGGLEANASEYLNFAHRLQEYVEKLKETS